MPVRGLCTHEGKRPEEGEGLEEVGLGRAGIWIRPWGEGKNGRESNVAIEGYSLSQGSTDASRGQTGAEMSTDIRRGAGKQARALGHRRKCITPKWQTPPLYGPGLPFQPRCEGGWACSVPKPK